MTKKILATYAPGELRIALLENLTVQEFYSERKGEENLVGAIFKGRVLSFEPSLNGAFIDLGLKLPGFLPLNPRFSNKINAGESLLVQVTREARFDLGGEKGPRLTQEIILPAFHLSYTPTQAGLRYASRLKETTPYEEELKATLAPEEGLYLLEPASKVPFSLLLQELLQLREIYKTFATAKPPMLLYKDLSSFWRLIRETSDISEIWCDNKSLFLKTQTFLKEKAPHLFKTLKYFDGSSLFEEYGAEEEWESLCSPFVPLKEGGSLLIEQTSAFTTIDINSSQQSGAFLKNELPYKTNLRAIPEIARQIRLKNLSGVILIDFISLKKPADKKLLLNSLKSTLKKDPVQTHVLGFSPTSIIELTRQRKRAPLKEQLFSPCPCCEGGMQKSIHTKALEALRELYFLTHKSPSSFFKLEVTEEIKNIFRSSLKEAVQELETCMGSTLTLESLSPSMVNSHPQTSFRILKKDMR